ncbi:MAG: hypothetical protein JO127_00305 [Caulobacteraceae bacterium]|nr:hypothetical protein [Caulobacteraceae bacterium]
MRKFLGWAAAIGVIGAAGVILFAFWDLDWRWRPHTITKHQQEIAQILAQAGWVSPRLTGPTLYMVSFRACPDCIRFERESLPKLQAASVDTRVIMVALRDRNGQARSTPAERATVAELWINRSWKLFQQWSQGAPEAWTAAGLAPADGDAARMAVVEASRSLTERLAPLLQDNGIRFAYPTLVWWTKDGRMRGCACESAKSYRYVEQELGA